MKKFPKKVYVTRTVNEDDETDVEYFLDETAQQVSEQDEQDTEVAVYQLVKVGRVQKSSKIVFDD